MPLRCHWEASFEEGSFPVGLILIVEQSWNLGTVGRPGRHSCHHPCHRTSLKSNHRCLGGEVMCPQARCEMSGAVRLGVRVQAPPAPEVSDSESVKKARGPQKEPSRV